MFRVPLQHNIDRATSLDDMSAEFKAFHFRSIKVIPLFCYSVIPYSAFYSVPHFGDTINTGPGTRGDAVKRRIRNSGIAE